MRIFGRLVVVGLLAGLLGCSPPARRDTLIQEVLKAGPEFGQVLEKHRELQNRIETYERELALKRNTIERNITQMRRDLAVAATNFRQKTAETKKRMEPDQQRLELALSMASEQLQATRLQRASLGRRMVKLRKTFESKDTPWSAEERTRQHAQLDDMATDAKRLDQEMASLKAHVRLLKIKSLLIKF